LKFNFLFYHLNKYRFSEQTIVKKMNEYPILMRYWKNRVDYCNFNHNYSGVFLPGKLKPIVSIYLIINIFTN